MHFKVNTVLAIGAVGAMMSPTFVELASSTEDLFFAGIPLIKADYAYSTIPIILLIVVMIYIEKAVHRIMPKALDDILSPLVILLVSSLLGLLAIGPLGTLIGNALSGSMSWLQARVPGHCLGAVRRSYAPSGHDRNPLDSRALREPIGSS